MTLIQIENLTRHNDEQNFELLEILCDYKKSEYFDELVHSKLVNLGNFSSTYKPLITPSSMSPLTIRSMYDSPTNMSPLKIRSYYQSPTRPRSPSKRELEKHQPLGQRPTINIYTKEQEEMGFIEPSCYVALKQNNYVSFLRLLSNLFNDYKITDRQFNIFMELFVHEDFAILSVYEVFMTNFDMNDLVESLSIIEIHEFHIKRLEIVNDFEDIRKQKSKQFEIIYKYKHIFSSMTDKTCRIFTILIQRGDKTVLDLYTMMKSKKISKKLFFKNMSKYLEFIVHKWNQNEKSKLQSKKFIYETMEKNMNHSVEFCKEEFIQVF